MFKLFTLKGSFLKTTLSYIIAGRKSLKPVVYLDPLLALINHGKGDSIMLIDIAFSRIGIILMLHSYLNVPWKAE